MAIDVVSNGEGSLLGGSQFIEPLLEEALGILHRVQACNASDALLEPATENSIDQLSISLEKCRVTLYLAQIVTWALAKKVLAAAPEEHHGWDGLLNAGDLKAGESTIENPRIETICPTLQALAQRTSVLYSRVKRLDRGS